MATVVFNGRGTVSETMDSVLSQDYPGLEYIVIDGGSTDGTSEIIERRGHHLACFISEPDRGVYDAMNKAVAHATGEFILFMNAGDRFYQPDSLSRLMAVVHRGELQVVCGQWIRRDGEGHDITCCPDPRRVIFNHQAILYSTELHRRHGLYATVPGFTTADYLFFAVLRHHDGVAWRVVDAPVAIIDPHGMSSGRQTFSQKHAIDYLLGRCTRGRLIAVLALHPLYHRIKHLWKRFP